jgi:hypothetical protein
MFVGIRHYPEELSPHYSFLMRRFRGFGGEELRDVLYLLCDEKNERWWCESLYREILAIADV